jgi:rod shape determining protein RodA
MAIEAVDTRARGLRPRKAVEALGVTGFVRRLDWLLLGAVAALVAYGIWSVDAITRHDPSGSLAGRQGIYVAGGVLLVIAAIVIDPDVYRRRQKPIYLGTLAMMAFVLGSAAATRGSRRWLDIGFFKFQPSEFGKVLFTLFLAGFLADRARRIGSLDVPLQAIGLALAPIILVFLQPDLGTALVYSAALAAVLFVSGVRWIHLGAIGLVALLGLLAVLWWLPAAGAPVLKPYQTKRITGFLHPESDPRDATYNVVQSKTAVGAGGLRGRGVTGATQTRLNYLPEHATDFAFASLAEQRGFFGVSVLLLLYLLVVWRGLKIVLGARDLFCAIVAGGLVFVFLFEVFVNVGMTIGIAPITGIPLPFLSVGGSAMITNLVAIGILQAIHARSVRRRA